MRTTWHYFSGGHWLFGFGAIAQLGKIARCHRARRALIITDRVLQSLGTVGRVTQPLAAAGVEVKVFDEGEVEPSTDVVAKTVSAAREFKPDLFVALGGGDW